jgi:O-antigen/teichoic acid export membrane protein
MSGARSLRERLAGLIGSRAVVRNLQWLLMEKLLRIALGILVGAWVARHLGPSRFGVLSYVIAFVGIFQAACQLGLDSIVVRDLSQRHNDGGDILGTALRLRLGAGAAGLVLALVTMAVLRPDDHESLLLTALIAGGLLFQAADTVDLWFQSQLQSRLSVIAKIVAITCSNGLRIVAILAGAGTHVFAGLMLVELALSALALSMLYRRHRSASPWRWRPQLVAPMLREAWPLLVAALAVLLYMRLDQILLRELVGERELGLYAAAQQLSAVWYFLPMIVCSSVAPELARLHVADPAAYLAALRRLFSLCWMLSLTLAVVMVAAAGPLIAVLYGPAYADATTALRLHSLAIIPVSLGIAQSLWITHEKRPLFALYRTLLGFVVSIAMNLALIPRFGAAGSAAAYLCCQFAAAILSNAVLAPQMLRLQFTSLLPVGRP